MRSGECQPEVTTDVRHSPEKHNVDGLRFKKKIHGRALEEANGLGLEKRNSAWKVLPLNDCDSLNLSSILKSPIIASIKIVFLEMEIGA